jgi:uncharacterized protein involved in outer membrane biogenesis
VLKKILVVVVIVIAALGFLVARDWDSPELGQALLDRVGQASGVELHAEGFRLNLLKGLVLEKVQGSSVGEGRKLAFTLDRLVFEHRLAPLLHGTIAIDRIVFERPSFDLSQSTSAGSKDEGAKKKTETRTRTGTGTGSGSGSAGPSGTEPSAGGGLALDVRQITIRDGSMVVKNEKGQEKTRVQDLDLEMANVKLDPDRKSLAALSAEGNLSIHELDFDTLKVTDASGRFELNDARFVIPELSFSLPNGKFVADTQIDFNPVPFSYKLSAKGEPIDVNGMVGAKGAKDGFGGATVRLDAHGAGPETRALAAKGQLQLAEGRFPDASMFSQIDDALGKKAVVGSPYKPTQMSFQIANDQVTLAPFRFESGDARLDLKGTMSLAGPIDFDLSVATPREGLNIQGAGGAVLDVLADSEGWVPVPMSIGGTMQDPKVRPDVKALTAQAGQGVKREATEKATDALRGLLQPKKKK